MPDRTPGGHLGDVIGVGGVGGDAFDPGPVRSAARASDQTNLFAPRCEPTRRAGADHPGTEHEVVIGGVVVHCVSPRLT
jgi:hypothetical protein